LGNTSAIAKKYLDKFRAINSSVNLSERKRERMREREREREGEREREKEQERARERETTESPRNTSGISEDYLNKT
jgi:hypothetical protein